MASETKSPDNLVGWGDTPAVTAPPVTQQVVVPQHLQKVERFFKEIIADESFLIDMCLERCLEMVEVKAANRRAGRDFFNEAVVTPEGLIQIATPLALELYKQTLEAIKGRLDEYTALLKEAQQQAARNGKGTIILPKGL